MDNIFFCIVRKTKAGAEYYRGYFESMNDSFISPSFSKNRSEGIKLTFQEEALMICNELNKIEFFHTWFVQEYSIIS